MFVETLLVTGWTLNVAVQLFATFIVTEPSVQSVSPDHPANTDPDAGLGVNVTTVPLLYVPEHVLPQLIPTGELETVPAPVPAFTMPKEKFWTAAGVVAQASGV
jgi:hypothetical protein